MNKKSSTILVNCWLNRKLMFQLAKNDFKTKYAGSFLGIVWGFIQPIITVLVYWFAFEKGLKMAGANLATGQSFPYVLWLSAGIVPWFFLQEAFTQGTTSLREYNYLVKKVVFNVEILPMMRVVAALFTHAFFVCFVVFFFCLYGNWPTFYTLQCIYYTFCVFCLSTALSYCTSAAVVFVKDLKEVVNIILQVGIWITPIMWNVASTSFSSTTLFILQLNPMFYVVQGYRDSLINQVGFWEHPGQTAYFWVFTILLYLLGTYIFKQLRKAFADML